MADVDVSALTRVLPSISNPNEGLESPFDFANQMSQAKLNALKVQQAQSEKIAGQLAQQAIDPATGQFSQERYNALLAQTPGAAQSAFTTMGESSKLTTDRLAQAKSQLSTISQYSAPLINNPSDDNVRETFRKLTASGALTAEQAAREMDSVMKMSPVQRQQYGYDHGVAALDGLARLHQQTGKTEMRTYGNVEAPTTTYQPTPTRPGGVVIGAPTTVGPPPDSTQTVKEWVDASGKPVPAGTPGASERSRVVPTAGNVVPTGGQPATGGGTGTGGAAAGQPPIPPPADAPNVTMPGRYVPRSGTTPPATPAPAVPPAAPASPFGAGAFGGGSSVAPAPTTTPVVTPPAVTQPPGLVTSTTIPATTAAEQDASQKLFIADRTALPQRQTQEQNLMHAYDALELVTSGKGTETAAKWRNLLATVGALPPGQVDDVAIYEVGRKYLEKTISDIGNAGGTDIARALAGASNPSMALTNPANLAVLRNDIGKIRQQMAANMTAPDKTTGAGYGNHAANHASNTDYRGFAWDKYSEPEKAEILKGVGAEGTPAHDALLRAIAMQKAFWPKKGAGPIVPHAAATPTAAPTNALAMAPSQGTSNPLLATA